MAVPAMELRSVAVSFPDGKGGVRAVLQGMDLQIMPGELAALTGLSGCGKSTALNLLAGRLRPQAGEILLRGEPVCGVPENLGYITQSDALLPWRTVLDNVAFGRELQGMPRAERREKAAEWLRHLRLGGYENSYPAQLSGGMRKRAAIARSLMMEPDILLLDEPFAPLDAFTREELQDVLLSLWEETGCTMLYVTHDIPEAVTLAGRVILMDAHPGRVLQEYAICLPRPRTVRSVRGLPEFNAWESAIRSGLEQSARQGEGVW